MGRRLYDNTKNLFATRLHVRSGRFYALSVSWFFEYHVIYFEEAVLGLTTKKLRRH